MPTATAVGLAGLELWGLNAYTAWYLWVAAFGVLLLRRPQAPVAQADAVGDDRAALNRVSSTRQ